MARQQVTAAEQMRRMQRGTKSADKLDLLRQKVKEARDLDVAIKHHQEEAKNKAKARLEIMNQTLPALFQEVGVRVMELEAEGNLPPYEVDLADLYYANIKAEWSDEQRDRAFELLSKMGSGDLIKQIVVVEFGRNTEKKQERLAKLLETLKVPYTSRRGVHNQTLTAWLKERYELDEPLSDQELEILGASVGTVARIKEKKPDRVKTSKRRK